MTGCSRALPWLLVTGMLVCSGCSSEPRYLPCGDPRCSDRTICSLISNLCLEGCLLEGDCAPDEICSAQSDVCEPTGATPMGAACRSEFECIAGTMCAPSRWYNTDSRVGVLNGDYLCRPTCPQSPATQPQPSQLYEPADDSPCPAGLVCVYEPVSQARQLDVCVPPCDPADASTCFDEMVCRYRECANGPRAAQCPDGTACTAGLICDGATAATGCLTPVEFDQRHPRPGWPR